MVFDIVVHVCCSQSVCVVRNWLVKSEIHVADRGVETQGWKESESESERQEDDDTASRSAANVQFTVGSDQ